jgi:DNA modification methylase
MVKPNRQDMRIDPSKNTIVCGDNLEWLNWIPDESVDLCYIDPPFFSNRNYEVIWGNGAELRSFGDRFSGGIGHYIEWMRERVVLIHRKLKPTGSIFLHCDWHASHRLRCMLDDIFGENNFRNEIVWQRKIGSNSTGTSKNWPNNTDFILFYSKSSEYFFKFNYINDSEHLPESIIQAYRHNDQDGKGPYQLGPLEAPSDSPTLKYTFKGVKSPKKGWRWKQDRMQDAFDKGLLYFSKDKSTIRQKMYLSNRKGAIVESIWLDIRCLQGQSYEHLGYPTQKPEALIRRIVESASKTGDIVLDCFAGGGTTAKVAADLGRSFITGDVSPVAVKVITERVSKAHPALDYVIKNLPSTEDEFRSIDGNEFASLFCELVGWKVNSKKVNDRGIDGFDAHGVPVQIKNHKNATGRPDIQKFLGALMAEKSKSGKFVAWEFSKAAMEYIADIKREHGIIIEPVKCIDRLGSLIISSEKQLELQVLYDQKRKEDWSKNVVHLRAQKKRVPKKSA